MVKKIKQMLVVCVSFVAFGNAQPPPPHPGGSGNQGASIPFLSVVGLVAVALCSVKTYDFKKS